MQIASTALKAVGVFSSYQSKKAESEAQAKAYDYNATVAERDRIVEERRQVFRELQDTDAFLRTKGKAIAAFGKAGVGFTGSVLDYMDDLTTQYQMGIQASRFDSEVTKNNLTDQANMARFNASITRSFGAKAAATQALGGVSDTLQGAYRGGLFNKSYWSSSDGKK